MSHDVFISYSSKDKTIADAICAKLEERIIRCWMAPRDIPVGQNFAKSIIYAINDSKVFVLVWSANTNTSEHILNEINQAFDQGIPIIPFRIEEVQPTVEMRYYFGRTHWLDAITPPLEKHIGTLAQSISALLESKQVISPEPIPIRNEGVKPELDKLEETPKTNSNQVPEEADAIKPSPDLERKTETVEGRKVNEEVEAFQPAGNNTQKKRKLFPMLAIGIIAVVLGMMDVLGVFKGLSPFAGTAPPTSTDNPIRETATLTPARVAASATSTHEPGTATPRKTVASVTPINFWATEFSGQIMTAIKYREPDFQDDFSYWKTDWHMEDGFGRPECNTSFSKIANGKLFLSSNSGCWSWAKLRNLDLHNFVVQIEMDLQQIESSAAIVISGVTDLEEFVFELSREGNWGTWYCVVEGKCTQSKYGQISTKGLTTPVTVTVIFNGNEDAVFVNSIPIYHDTIQTEIITTRHVNITVQDANESIPQKIVEFDNLKIWDLDMIESISRTPTKSN